MPTKFAMRLLAGTAVSALLTGASIAAEAQARPFDIPQQDAATALQAFAMQSGRQVLFPYEAAKGKQAPEIRGDYSDEEVIALLAASAGLKVSADDGRTVTLRPQFAQAAEAGGGSEVEALIVTAQKREEDIQDVPIAISAFTQEQLENSQVAGGPDLMTQVPNFTFTKTNFTSYSIQIRGIGTQAISATTDPAVAIAFNNTPFVRNRFFEQEFYDLQRVEVLRGPQGTLYGRNATAGVVNIISQKPKFAFEAKASGDVSNYNSTRIEGMINVPLVDDRVAMRLAGAWTKREGYVTNEITGNPIDGRDLWSTRLSLRFAPTDRLDVNLIWEHFEEDDDRLRSGKQLCKKHVITEVGGVAVDYYDWLPDGGQEGGVSSVQSVFSQGCLPNSLYDQESFQTPNGYSVPYYMQLGALGLPIARNDVGGLGNSQVLDPYLSRTQSSDLRVIESTVDPSYKAKTDVVELQFTYDLTDALSLTSETAWSSDFIFSTQDFNRFNTSPGAFDTGQVQPNPLTSRVLDENGVFCDPQVGCADRLVAIDLSTATSHHFSQEFRLGSDFDGPFNFSLGGNFLRYDTEDKYYVFINTLSLIAAIRTANASNPYGPGFTNYDCLTEGARPPDLRQVYGLQCVYIDPNPIGNLNDQGHNYFLSRNPFKLISYAVFGEAYYNVTDALKITAGLRWTVDKKEAPRIPSWVLAGATVGYPVQDVTEQEWREPTGRLTVDWKPDLGFTDETLLYASAARGYKAGGANPPPFGIVMYCPECAAASFVEGYLEKSATHPRTFDPEYVNAFEVGSKNTLLDGNVTVNLAAFYYDYKGYQISQIVNRSAVNHNFDAEVWGLEIEADWRPLENLRLGFKGGYENTRVADGESAVDIMDRANGGRPDENGVVWSVVRPFPTFPSSCILPTYLYVNRPGYHYPLSSPGSPNGGGPGGCEIAYVLGLDPVTYLPYQPDDDLRVCGTGPCKLSAYNEYPGFDPRSAPNFGEGFSKDLSGNELPNAPNFTATITADYTVPLPNDWLATLHTDLYYQSEAWTRIFNTEGYDKLKAYTNVNLAAIFTNDEAGWKVMAYVKNVFDRDSITGAFLNSDDTGLTTNVFLTEPRLYGLRVTKEWSGGPWWTGANPNHTGPYPLTVELGGQVQRHDAPYGQLAVGFEDEFPDELDVFARTQNRDLDWGDGREVKLTYRPASGPWTISGSVRYGRTNSDTGRERIAIASPERCFVHPDFWFIVGGTNPCLPTHPLYEAFGGPETRHTTTNWSTASGRDQEQHDLVEFSVGRDIAIGGLSRSSFSAGLRHATFDSETWATMAGTHDREIFDGWFFPGPTNDLFNEYDAALHARRHFEGMGPVLSWDAALPLLGGDETGRLELDWSLSGGVLMGDQESEASGQARQRVRRVTFGTGGDEDLVHTLSTVDISPEPVSRTEDVEVPVAGASLGLAYDIQRIRIGAGYRWERYFDVLDVGFGEAEQGDRTIDGPYFKLSVGFGG